MAKNNLATKLAIGAIAGAAMFGGVGKADANPIINYSNSVTQVNADGLGTFGDDAEDFYTVGLWVKNFSQGTIAQDSCTNLVYNTDLVDRGAYNFRDEFSVWTFNENGAGQDQYDFNGQNLVPTADNTVYYDVKADDVLGWESTTAYLEAESGQSNLLGDVTIPTIPEPATLGLIAGAGAALLGIRRFFRI